MRSICYEDSDSERKLPSEESDIEVGEDDQNPFESLQDDLIIHHISDKFPEAKHLCRYSLVSKHFSSFIRLPILSTNSSPWNLSLSNLIAAPVVGYTWGQVLQINEPCDSISHTPPIPKYKILYIMFTDDCGRKCSF